MTVPVSNQLSDRASEWLPDEALVAASAFAAIDARIAVWSARWFARPVRRQAGGGTPAALAVRPMPRHGWRRFAPGIWFDWGEHTAQALALQALGRPEPRPKLSPDDENLVAMLGERLASDLAMSLVKSLAQPLVKDDGGPARAICIKLSGATQTSGLEVAGLAVAIDAALLARLRQQQCPPWQPRDAQAQPFGAIFGSIPIAFEIALGSVSIGLLEFEAIELGDTIVLDQQVAGALSLRAAATGATIRATRLVREDGQLTLIAS